VNGNSLLSGKKRHPSAPLARAGAKQRSSCGVGAGDAVDVVICVCLHHGPVFRVVNNREVHSSTRKMPTVHFVWLSGQEDVAPPFRTPISTVTLELFHHVEARTHRAVRLCAGDKVLERGDALPDEGVVVVAPTPHRTLAHVGALDPRVFLPIRTDVKEAVVDRHGCPLTFVIRNTRVVYTLGDFFMRCALNKLQQAQVGGLPPCNGSDTITFNFNKKAPDGVGVGDSVDVVFYVGFHYFYAVSICKVYY
jgi:hypothetical protein